MSLACGAATVSYDNELIDTNNKDLLKVARKTKIGGKHVVKTK